MSKYKIVKIKNWYCSFAILLRSKRFKIGLKQD